MREEGKMINTTSGKSVFPVGKESKSGLSRVNKVSLLRGVIVRNENVKRVITIGFPAADIKASAPIVNAWWVA